MALDLLATILYAEDFLNGEEAYWSLMATPGVWLLWFVGILFLAFGIYVQVWAND